MTLTDTLHDTFLSSGEILPAADIARIVQEHEMWNGVEYDAETILRAIREAGERFVDSMVQNEHDTEQEVKGGMYQGFPIDPIEKRVAKWEAMRPSAIRRSSILSLVQSAKPESLPMKTAHYISGKQPLLIISETMRPVGQEIKVSGKREARTMAKAHGAKPWNF